MMPHNSWGSTARRPCARWHPPAIGGRSHSCRVLITFMLRQAQHERSRGLFTTRKFAFSLAMPPTQPFDQSITKSHPHRSPGASRYTNLPVRLEPVERSTGTPQLARIRSCFDRLSTNGVSDFSGTLNGDVNFRSRGDRTREDTDYDVARYRPDTG